VAERTAKAKAPARKRATKPARKGGAKEKRGGARASVSPKATTAKRQAKAKGTATTARKRAKAAGAVGPNGSDAQRALRDTAIIACLESGESVEAVAKDFGISVRSVKAIRTKRSELPSPLNAMPMDILEGLVKEFRQSIADFNRMAHAHAATNPAVAVGAMKGALVARERYLELLSIVGKLPSNLELFQAESVLRRLADELRETMEKVERGEMTVVEAAAFFRSLVQGSESAERQRALPVASS